MKTIQLKLAILLLFIFTFFTEVSGQWTEFPSFNDMPTLLATSGSPGHRQIRTIYVDPNNPSNIYIAMWDGTNWRGVGSGLTSLLPTSPFGGINVLTITKFQGDLYVGGYYQKISRFHLGTGNEEIVSSVSNPPSLTGTTGAG